MWYTCPVQIKSSERKYPLCDQCRRASGRHALDTMVRFIPISMASHRLGKYVATLSNGVQKFNSHCQVRAAGISTGVFEI